MIIILSIKIFQQKIYLLDLVWFLISSTESQLYFSDVNCLQKSRLTTFKRMKKTFRRSNGLFIFSLSPFLSLSLSLSLFLSFYLFLSLHLSVCKLSLTVFLALSFSLYPRFCFKKFPYPKHLFPLSRQTLFSFELT